MLKLAHIINPVKVGTESDLSFAQPITFESMRQAKQKAAYEIEVQLFTTQYPEDHEVIPEYFFKLPDLERSVLDVRAFSRPRKYPLIGDILDRLYENTDAEYLIFTNTDIGLMPDFYLAVKKLLNKGHDAIIINRRRIPSTYHSINQLPEIFKEKGKSHPGFDCFVFNRELLPKMHFGNICVGIPYIGVNLAHNLFCYANNPKLIDKDHLTFHLGMEVMPRRDKEYYWHNRKEFEQIRSDILWDKFDISKFPYANENIIKRYWKWGMNPSIFLFSMLKLEIRDLKSRILG